MSSEALEWEIFFNGIMFFILAFFIYILFNNQYPCTESGIGCLSVIELIGDVWASVVSFMLLLIGLCFCIMSFADKEE